MNFGLIAETQRPVGEMTNTTANEKISALQDKMNASYGSVYDSVISDLLSRVAELEKNDKVRQLEEEMSIVRRKINTHSEVIRNLNSNMLKLKEKEKNPIYEKTIIQAIEEATNEIVKALKALHDELIK